MPKKTEGQEARDERRAKEKEAEDIIALARRKSIGAFQRIVAVSEDQILRQKNPVAYLKANEAVIERAHGKPAQALEISGPDGEAVRHCVVSDKPLTEKEWVERYGSGVATPAGAAKGSG